MVKRGERYQHKLNREDIEEEEEEEESESFSSLVSLILDYFRG